MLTVKQKNRLPAIAHAPEGYPLVSLASLASLASIAYDNLAGIVPCQIY